MSELKFPLRAHLTSAKIFDSAIYVGFLIFVLSLPFGYSAAPLNAGLSLVLFGWVGRMVATRKRNWKRTSLDVPIVLFLALALIASLLAPHPARSSLGYFWKLLRALLLFYAVIHSGLGTRWQHVVIAFIVAAGLSSALGLWYYANDTRLAMDFMGRVGLQFQTELADGERISDELRAELRTCNVPLSQTASFSPSKHPDEWRIDDSARERRYVVRKGETHLSVYMIEQRLTGSFKMPNDLGAYLALSLPLAMGYLLASWRHHRKQKASRWATLALGAAVAMMGATLALSLTRAAWVSVAVATIFVGFYLTVSALREARLQKEKGTLGQREPSGRVWKRVLLGLAFISALLCASSFLVPRHIKARFQTMIEHPAGFMGERPQWWRTSLQLMRKYPLTGIGLGRFRYEYQLIKFASEGSDEMFTTHPLRQKLTEAEPEKKNGQRGQYETPYHAHNVYLHIAVEHGIPSLCLFLWMLVIICRQVFAMRRATDFWGIGAFIGGCGFLISALVYGLADNILHQRTVLIFWFIIGLIFYIQSHKDEKHEKHEKTQESDRVG